MRELLFVLEKAIAAFLLAVLSITIFIQVLARYVFDFPLAWSEEVSRYSFIWLTMIAAPICIRQKANVGMDVLTRNLPERYALTLEAVSYALVMVLAAVLLVWGVSILNVVKMQRSPALDMPMSSIYAAIPIGGALMIIELSALVYASLKRLKTLIEGK